MLEFTHTLHLRISSYLWFKRGFASEITDICLMHILVKLTLNLKLFFAENKKPFSLLNVQQQSTKNVVSEICLHAVQSALKCILTSIIVQHLHYLHLYFSVTNFTKKSMLDLQLLAN